MTIRFDGQTIIGHDGAPIIPLGQNLGLGEITTTADTTEAAAEGATGTRVVSRWDGTYGEVFQQDSRDDMQPHRVRPEYVEMYRGQLYTARNAGQLTVLGMDSDNLQGRRGSGFYDAWTPDGRRRRRQHMKLGRFYSREFAPMLDMMEPIVEPQGPNVTQQGLWGYQEEFMLSSLERNPDMHFLLGGAPSYQPAYISRVFRPEWANTGSPFNGRIALTFNVADELCRNEGQFENRLAGVLAERERWNVPVLVNQIWTDPPNDPDGAILAARIDRLASLGIGSMVWTACARYGAPGQGGPGLRYLADPNNPASEHIKHVERWAAVAAVWRKFVPSKPLKG